MEWNLRRRLEAARDERKHTADDEELIDLDAEASGSVTTAARPHLDYRTVRSVRETQEAQLRARREAEALAEREAAARRPGRVVPLIGEAKPSVPPPDGAPATVSTIMRQESFKKDLIVTTKPAEERCPNCNGGVRIDMFDLVQAVAHLSCVDCGFTYTATSPAL